MIDKLCPYLFAFFLPLVLALILTPIVRELNRWLGMIDKPDSRRINKVPIPRGGGLALFLSILISVALLMAYYGGEVFGLIGGRIGPLIVLSCVIVAIGYTDDKFGMNPKLKLLGQLLVAFLTWWWIKLGFHDIWPDLPVWIDCVLTVFWITGAINAFNLIDGLDGLASGLALIATIGMAGSLFFTGHSDSTFFYFVFAGALLGFLRYNYNPASVFLGDSGSMLIGFIVSVLPLNVHTADSFLVSVGVPLLAMGVPIFDTSLAILRRSIRRFLQKDGAATGNGEVMTADTDHLHHRILRAAGFNQRKAAWSLYALAAFFVAVGIVGVCLKSKSAGLWMAALAVATVVVFRDMSRVELFDMGLLLGRVAHSRDLSSRRRWAKLSVPFFVVSDVLLLVLAFMCVTWISDFSPQSRIGRFAMPIRVVAVFGALVFFKGYSTIWSRAVMSNFLRLFLACVSGSVFSGIVLYYFSKVELPALPLMTLLYALVSFIMLSFTRIARSIVRDLFYAIDRKRLIGHKDVSRLLVYGTGLRYRAFRRELVRSSAANSRIIVGLIDDDLLLRGKFIGGCQVMGTLQEAREIVNNVNANEVIITFEMTPEWEKVVRETFAPTGVKLIQFKLLETEI